MHDDDNPSNNRLDNLKIWTHQDNIKDMYKKWRNNSKRIWKSLLKEQQVKRIKLMLEIWNLSHEKIWKFFWVTRTSISMINCWKRWNFIS